LAERPREPVRRRPGEHLCRHDRSQQASCQRESRRLLAFFLAGDCGPRILQQPSSQFAGAPSGSVTSAVRIAHCAIVQCRPCRRPRNASGSTWHASCLAASALEGEPMKKLEATILPSQVDAVRDALIQQRGLDGFTVTEAWGIGATPRTGRYRGSEYYVD